MHLLLSLHADEVVLIVSVGGGGRGDVTKCHIIEEKQCSYGIDTWSVCICQEEDFAPWIFLNRVKVDNS